MVSVSLTKKWPTYLLAIAVAFVAVSFVRPHTVHAAACTAPATDYGTVTLSVNIPATGTYRIWTRMSAPDTSNNTYLLDVDSTSCYTVGGSTVPTYASGATTYFANNSTNWINVTSSGTQVSYNFTNTGTHTLKLIGNAANVVVDRIILTQDTTCTPTGTGDNCVTVADTTPPTLSAGPTASGISQTGTTIAWTTNEASDTQVEYGKTTSYGSSTTLANTSPRVTSHTVALTGLSPGTTYHYRVKSSDSSGNQLVSADKTFKTTDTTGPTVSVTPPTNPASGTITVAATASDNVGVTSVQFQLDGVNLGTADTTSPYGVTWNTASVTNGTHTLTAVAKDGAGNSTTSSPVTVTVSNALKAADINQDGVVDIRDFYGYKSKFGQSGSGIGRADINQDGTVDIRDFYVYKSQFGT